LVGQDVGAAVSLDRLVSLPGLAERNHVISKESAVDAVGARNRDFGVLLLDAVLAAMSRVKRRQG
jgi:hypothetical protein